MTLLFNPKNDPQIMPVPYCALQIVTNYQYKRQGYMSVSTIVLPVTVYLSKLYPTIDVTTVNCCFAKGFLSSLRTEDTIFARKKLTESISSIYLEALRSVSYTHLDVYKRQILLYYSY